ncbi:MAG TPA: energy transducer TonB [Candidatus Eremiobacteraceae bacterium]|jgi:TonB family protein
MLARLRPSIAFVTLNRSVTLVRAAISCSVALVVAFTGLAQSRAAAADCPIQLRSVVFGAQSSSHDFVSYAVHLNGAPQTGTNAQLSVRLADGTHVEMPWSNITIEKPQFPRETTAAFGWFDRSKADVTAAAVDAVSPAPGQSPLPCDGTEVALNATDNAAWGFEVLNARKHVFSASVVAVPVVHHKSADAGFITKVSPSYPVAEKEANVQGDVTVRITVGTDGHVSRATVVDSSQDDGLDKAGLDAALQTTLHPATIDGVPTARDYLIVYTFRLQEESQDPNISYTADFAPKSNCPLSAKGMELVNAGTKNGPDWYSMFFTATRTDIVAAEIEFLDAASEDVSVRWDSITVPPLDKDRLARITASMPWNGSDPLKFWVADVKYANGHQQACSTYYELADRSSATAALPRTLEPSTQTVRVETRRYEAPLVESYPTYPPASLAADVTGDVGVDVVVNDAGNATGALVVSSSKSTDLDNAALSAAMKTKFAPRHDASYFPMRVFYLDYDFEDNVE